MIYFFIFFILDMLFLAQICSRWRDTFGIGEYLSVQNERNGVLLNVYDLPLFFPVSACELGDREANWYLQQGKSHRHVSAQRPTAPYDRLRRT